MGISVENPYVKFEDWTIIIKDLLDASGQIG